MRALVAALAALLFLPTPARAQDSASVGAVMGSVLRVCGAQVTQGGLLVNKSQRCLTTILLPLCCVVVTPVHAADTADRQYALTDHGSLQLQVPTL